MLFYWLDLLRALYKVCSHIMARSDSLCGLHKVCSHIMGRSDLLCCLHKVCSHIMARSDLLCCLHKVCSHIMARSDLFISLSTRVERLSRGKSHMYALRTYLFNVSHSGHGYLLSDLLLWVLSSLLELSTDYLA